MSDSEWKYTHTLAGLYSAQGRPQQAEEILTSLQPGSRGNTASGPKSAQEQERKMTELAALVGKWIDLLRRRRFLETKP
ncbi:MAG: hypothetical protein ACLFQ9_01910 [Desulfobacterales bacterium]